MKEHELDAIARGSKSYKQFVQKINREIEPHRSIKDAKTGELVRVRFMVEGHYVNLEQSTRCEGTVLRSDKKSVTVSVGLEERRFPSNSLLSDDISILASLPRGNKDLFWQNYWEERQ